MHVGCFADDDRDMSFAPAMAEMTASQCVLKRDRSRVVAGLTGLVKRQPMLVSLFDDPRLHQWVRQTLAERPIARSAVASRRLPSPLLGTTRFLMSFPFDTSLRLRSVSGGWRVRVWYEPKLLRKVE